MRRLVRIGGALATSGVLACTTLAGIADYTIGDCKGGVCEDGGVTDADDRDQGVVAADDSGVPCRGKPLPAAVRVGSPGNTFCIDTTEVTVGDYAQFLAAAVDPSTQPPSCAWNTDFAAEDPSDAGASHPVVGVDWCDALAYCTWAGKYLCGTVENGKKTGPVTVASSSDFRSDQWLLACSEEARLRYSYGSLLDRSACNFFDYDAGHRIPAGEAPGCVGGYSGIHDLLGNVWEWYDGPCIADGTLEEDGGDGGPQSDGCWIKGGSYADLAQNVDCRADGTGIRRDRRLPNVGFRCCSD